MENKLNFATFFFGNVLHLHRRYIFFPVRLLSSVHQNQAFNCNLVNSFLLSHDSIFWGCKSHLLFLAPAQPCWWSALSLKKSHTQPSNFTFKSYYLQLNSRLLLWKPLVLCTHWQLPSVFYQGPDWPDYAFNSAGVKSRSVFIVTADRSSRISLSKPCLLTTFAWR